MLLPELDQIRPKGICFRILKGAQVSDGKVTEGVIRIANGLLDGIEASTIVFLFGAELRVHSVALTIHQFGGK